MSSSSLDELLDDYDKALLMENSSQTTEDGFKMLSREIMSQPLSSIDSENSCENRPNSKLYELKELNINTVNMTTDDGMKNLARNSMTAVVLSENIIEGNKDENIDNDQIENESENENETETEQGSDDENTEGLIPEKETPKENENEIENDKEKRKGKRGSK